MNTFDAPNLCDVILRLTNSEESYRSFTQIYESTDPLEDSEVETLRSQATRVELLCDNLGFNNASEKARLSVVYLSEKWRKISAPAVEVELRNLREAIITDLDRGSYLYVRHERATYVDHQAIFGPAVARAFPSAGMDLKEAGNCLAAECNTAAVFHLMRAVEWGLTALCVHLGLRKVKSVTKGGKKKYTPVSYVDWEKMLNQLHPLVDAKIDKLKRGHDKQKFQEFYYPVLQDIKGIRDAWRNHIMHTRAHYTPKGADVIFDHVKRLMGTLATKVSEC